MKFLKTLTLLATMTLGLSAKATLTSADIQDLADRSMLVNGGFENGKQRWTASGGTFSIVTSGSNLLSGKNSATWDSNGASQTLTSTAAAIPKGLYGVNGLAQCKIQTPSGNATHTLQVYDGSNIVASQTITSSTVPSVTQVNFVFPSSGNLSVRLVSVASDEPLIAVDDCYLGPALNLSSASQAKFIGSAYFATTASCTWARTNTAIGSFGTTSACPGPTVDLNPGPGTIQTTDTDLPKVTVNNLPPGNFKVCFTGSVQSSTTMQAVLVITDGTTQSPIQTAAPGAGSNADGPVHVCGFWNYTTTANRTFELQGASDNGTITISNQDKLRRTGFYIEMFPASNDLLVTPAVNSQAWSGYHDGTCSWARTNASYGDPTADATCALVEQQNFNFGSVTTYNSGGNALPGIVITPKRASLYFVCASFNVNIGSSSAIGAVLLTDGTNNLDEWNRTTSANFDGGSQLCGMVNASSTASKTISLQTKANSGTITLQPQTQTNAVYWKIFPVNQQVSAPLLVNSVISPSSGVEKVVRATITGSATTPTVASQSGSWISSVTRNSIGNYTLNIPAGTFSSAPSCTCRCKTTSPTIACEFFTATTSTAVEATCADAGSFYDNNREIICMGPN